LWKWRGFLGLRNEVLEMAWGFGVLGLGNVEMAEGFGVFLAPDDGEYGGREKSPCVSPEIFFMVNKGEQT